MFPAALAVALLAGVAWSCPEGFNLIDFNLCASKIESFSWEEGHSECAHSGGPSAVLSPTGFSTWIVPPELKLPKWALPKELGMETRTEGQCRVMPGCVTMNQTCHGLLSVKFTERGVCHEKIRNTADESCDVVVEMGCEQSDWNAADKFDCFKHKEQHFVPSVNLILREDYATVSISNRHLLDDCWCILAKLDIFENNKFDAVVLSNLPPGSSFNITFPDSNYDFKQGALWCQCFDKWTGLMVKTDVFSTGFSSQRCNEHDPCTPSPCGPNSVCREVVGSAACSCKPHYSGSPPNCHSECLINSDCPSNTSCIMQKCRDPCPGPCPFGSLCKVTDHEPQCTCPDGYVGDALVRCRPGPDAQKDLCSPSPCGPNAVCRGGLCGCRMGYSGDPYKGCKAECDLNSECSASRACIIYNCVDPCFGACGRNALCAVENHKPMCFCPAGATGNPFESCRTTHPCTPSPCGPNSICREDGDSAVCSCKPHYIGSPPNCRSECLINSDCPSNTSCIMEKCRDPCPGPCPFGSLCKVTEHEPQCTCPDGYVGDALVRCRQDRYPQKDLCSPFPCGRNAICRGGLCGCRRRYSGDPYKGCKPECELNSECSASTACINNKCVDPCPRTCGRNAVCAVENHKPMCFCPEGAAGNPFVSCRTTRERRVPLRPLDDVRADRDGHSLPDGHRRGGAGPRVRAGLHGVAAGRPGHPPGHGPEPRVALPQVDAGPAAPDGRRGAARRPVRGRRPRGPLFEGLVRGRGRAAALRGDGRRRVVRGGGGAAGLPLRHAVVARHHAPGPALRAHGVARRGAARGGAAGRPGAAGLRPRGPLRPRPLLPARRPSAVGRDATPGRRDARQRRRLRVPRVDAGGLLGGETQPQGGEARRTGAQGQGPQVRRALLPAGAALALRRPLGQPLPGLRLLRHGHAARPPPLLLLRPQQQKLTLQLQLGLEAELCWLLGDPETDLRFQRFKQHQRAITSISSSPYAPAAP